MLSLCSFVSGVTRDCNSSLWNLHPCILFPENIILPFWLKGYIALPFLMPAGADIHSKTSDNYALLSEYIIQKLKQDCSMWIKAETSQLVGEGLFAHRCISPWQLHSALLMLRAVTELPWGGNSPHLWMMKMPTAFEGVHIFLQVSPFPVIHVNTQLQVK